MRQLRSDQEINIIVAKRELKDALTELNHEKITLEGLVRVGRQLGTANPNYT